ncbi:hypothetical protein KIN20_027565 [Parelaphostrongylus tenuis]|uniref:Uncharacterized protein n=1 Tax=Parelaphostrongylus tenuis TaxID=148309 RepID=A0AAD5WDZ3_PARTN|nr:hypothetical protein KIN20_027565 [Parelaphostrongylus tenuis]
MAEWSGAICGKVTDYYQLPLNRFVNESDPSDLIVATIRRIDVRHGTTFYLPRCHLVNESSHYDQPPTSEGEAHLRGPPM